LIHPSAVIDEGAKVPESARIWHFVHVCSGASIGEDASLGQGVYVGPGVAIGARCKVQNNVSVYEGVTLEEDVFVGPSAVFTNVTYPRAHVPRRHEFKPTLVKRGATIGANATILCGVTVGEFSMIGAGAVVTKDVPPYALVVGVPAQVVGQMCACGVPLKGPKCLECGE